MPTSLLSKWVKIVKTEKTIELHLVMLSEVCGKVLSEKYAYKSVKDRQQEAERVLRYLTLFCIYCLHINTL